ncbi:MAG: hypothetical protein IPM29_08325 [Planctomycetes bacterium]|nr:hypothetical protein [Planctomycetota bacterium]
MRDKRPGRGAVEDVIVIAVPAACKSMVSSIEALCAAVASRAASSAAGREAMDYAVSEVMVAELTGAVERDAHAVMLGALEVDAPRVEIDGKTFTRVGYGNGRNRSLAGTVEVRRALCRPLGEGNAPTVDAISLRADGIGDGWLPQTSRAMALELQKASSREGEQSGKETRRTPYSRASFERIPHELGALYLRRQVDIEDAIVTSLEIPTEARAISALLDRASVPMEEPIPQPAGRPKKHAPKLTRLPHGLLRHRHVARWQRPSALLDALRTDAWHRAFGRVQRDGEPGLPPAREAAGAATSATR